MDWMRIIAELGGAGAIAPLVGGVFTVVFKAIQGHIDNSNAWTLKAAGVENKANAEKLAQLEQSNLGKGVVWLIVGTSFAVLSAGVWAPILGWSGDMFVMYVNALCVDHPMSTYNSTIAVEWYWPKEGSFLFWKWEELQIIRAGSPDAKHIIVILPTFISFGANAVSFFLMNRVRKKLF